MRATAIFLCLISAPALAQPGPHVTPGEYEAARAAPFGEAVTARWMVTRAPLDESGEGQTVRHDAVYGQGWTAWRRPDGVEKLADIDERRLLTLDAETGLVTNVSLYAEARRRVDIYVALSRGGMLEEIEFGAAGRFHRVWLEAAMGVTAEPGALAFETAPSGFSAHFDGETVFTADFGEGGDSLCEAPAIAGYHAPAALAWLRHAAPVHPDVISRLEQEEGFPCAFTLAVYSPESPQGRRETWVLAGAGEDDDEAEAAPAALILAGGDMAGLESVLPGADLLGAAGETGLAAARGEAGDPPDPIAFFEHVQALGAEGDHAGAWLAAIQETHHFGPCPQETVGSIRLTCVMANALTQGAHGDARFERAAEGVEAFREQDYPRAVDRLDPFALRDDAAGAAARLLSAEALVGWGQEGLETRPDLDPAALMIEALELDPYAPAAYLNLGRRFMEAGAPEAAWTLFDLARALPERDGAAVLARIAEIEAGLETLAPHWLPPLEGAGE